MSGVKLGIVGGGQMGRALVSGIISGQVVAAADIQLVEPSSPGRQWWSDHQPKVAIGQLAEQATYLCCSVDSMFVYTNWSLPT